MDKNLGRLERVGLREVWNGEALDFTPWLAEESNLELLGNAIGIELELESIEKDVGPFRADIVCKDMSAEDSWVLVENQLERTDHTHLGQLLTYAAGLKAVTVVWIAKRFTDEHRAALDWLNEITGKQFNFFGLEIELWRIGDSPMAPKFNVVSEPNDWTKSVVGQRNAELSSPAKKLQLEFWTEFREYVVENSQKLKPQKALPQNWTHFAVGRTGFAISALVNTMDNRLGVELMMSDDDAKAHFHLLKQQEADITREFLGPLEWRELPENKSSYITTRHEVSDIEDRSRWPQYFEWLMTNIERFRDVFSHRVKNLDASDYAPPQPPENE